MPGMSSTAEAILGSLDRRVDAILDACTACGKCAEVCPTPGLMDIVGEDPGDLATGVLDILRGEAGPEASRTWAAACCGTGNCLSVCEHGINPRFMLNMARRAMTRDKPEDDRRDTGKAAFKTMSRAVRVISRLQLPPALMERLSPSSHPERASPPEVIFYTGCNMLKTPHIGLICLDILDRLGVAYEVYGGPSNCCGILQYRPGDTANAGRQAARTIERFAGTGASDVLSWCPTCQIQFGETLAAEPFDIRMFPVYLAERLNDLRPMMTGRVERRVALHEYPGSPGVTESVVALLSAIPGIEVVDLGIDGIGYHMTSLITVPETLKHHVAETLRKAEAAGVTTLAGIYHGDHRELVSHQSQWPFDIVNYMELIGESMGIRHEDVFKRMKLMRDADAILAEAAPLIEAHGLDPEEVRDVVISDIVGGNMLPLERAHHPAAEGD